MSTYELDDDVVKAIVAGGWSSAEINALTQSLEEQLPLPVPQNIGAVVETLQVPNGIARQFLRYAYEVSTVEPWIEVGDRDMLTYRTDTIGRITKVLSEGADL